MTCAPIEQAIMKLPRSIIAAAASLLAAASLRADPTLSLGSLHADAGATASVPLTLSGATNVVAFQADVVFNAAVLSSSAAMAGPALGPRALDSSQPASGVRRVLIYSPDNTPLSNGVVANLQFTAELRPPATVAPLAFANVILTTTNAEALAYNTSSGAVTVNLKPFITTQPPGQTVPVGATAVFSVSAIGSAPLSYQWRILAANIPGATNSTLILTNVQLSQQSLYRVVVANSLGTALSALAPLTVVVPPSITNQPASTNVAPGASVTLSVTATGTSPLRYQWRRNGSNLSGATNATLLLSNLQPSQAGSYDVVITNNWGLAASSVAIVSVNIVNNPPVHLNWAVDQTNGQPRFRLTWTANQDFVIEASTDLLNWIALMTNAAPLRVSEFVDPGTSLYPQRFFRARNRP